MFEHLRPTETTTCDLNVRLAAVDTEEHEMSLQTHDQTPRTSVRKHERITSHVNRLEEHDERLMTG